VDRKKARKTGYFCEFGIWRFLIKLNVRLFLATPMANWGVAVILEFILLIWNWSNSTVGRNIDMITIIS